MRVHAEMHLNDSYIGFPLVDYIYFKKVKYYVHFEIKKKRIDRIRKKLDDKNCQ